MINKKRWFDLLYVVLIFSVIGFMVWIAMFLQENRTECLKDPINYFETKNEDVMCVCQQYNQGYTEVIPQGDGG